MRWEIVTTMPSTGDVTCRKLRSGSPEEFEQDREAWADTPCVEVVPLPKEEGS